MDQGPWQPIRERSAGEAALEAAGGDAGEALFFAYIAQAFPGEGHEEMVLERLERAIAALAEDSAGPSLCSGFAGVAWATAHLMDLHQVGTPLADDAAEEPRVQVETRGRPSRDLWRAAMVRQRRPSLRAPSTCQPGSKS